jgi:hypothetical protein
MAHYALHYRYHPLHQDIICAETAITSLPATVDALGARRAMITCGPTILRASLPMRPSKRSKRGWR